MYGYDFDSLDMKWRIPDRVEPELRYPRIFVRGEGVGKRVGHRPACLRIGINVHILMLGEVEGAYVVHAGGMVHMLMGEQDKIQMFYPFTEHLLPEIGAGVDDKPLARIFHQHGTPQPFVVRVC